MEHNGLQWVGVSGVDGTFRGVLVEPGRGHIRHSVRFRARSDGSKFLTQLPSLVATAGPKEWDEHFLVCALSAIAAAKGFPTVAEAAQELTPRVAAEFLEWFLAR